MRSRLLLVAALVGSFVTGAPLLARVLLSTTGAEVTSQARKFLETLTADQTKVARLNYDAKERLDWHFIPKKERKGLQVRDMNEAQRAAAKGLLKSCLSQVGYDKATKIMELETLLHELETKKNTRVNIRDPERYFFTLFGEPTGDKRWGLSIEGHHLTLNFVLEKEKVVSWSPAALCANPAEVRTDLIPKFKGWRILAQEELLAFELLGSLNADQKQTAVVAETALKEIRAPGEAQPPTDAPVGIVANKLTADQKKTLQKLVEVYCRNFPEDLAAARLGEIESAGWDQVHFAWMGAEKPGIGHYYRVQGPTFVIEFVNTQPDADGNPANHIHCIWRDMRGDFALPIK